MRREGMDTRFNAQRADRAEVERDAAIGLAAQQAAERDAALGVAAEQAAQREAALSAASQEAAEREAAERAAVAQQITAEQAREDARFASSQNSYLHNRLADEQRASDSTAGLG